MNMTLLLRSTQLLLHDGNTLTIDQIDPAHAQTTFYRVDIARSIADDARKTDTTLTLGGRRFGFGYSFSHHCNTRM